jgi:hypothetical protein
MSKKARIAAAAVALAASAVAAAPASAATVTVTGDDGNPVAIAPGSTTPLRNMHADVNVAPAAGERYRLTVTGPGGQVASSLDCYSIATGDRLDFLGNGTYTGTLTTYTTSGCSGAGKTTSFAIALNASVAINVPSPSKVLTREPNGTFLTHSIPVALNPGSLSTQVHYAKGGVLAPDGSISGASERDYVDQGTGVSTISFLEPGTYLLVAHAEGYTSSLGTFYSPWSAPVKIKAYAPFDFLGQPYLSDSRGPRYKLAGQLREKTARGKIKLSLKRGGGKFRSIGKAKIRRGGKFSKRFTVNGTGNYTLKYVFKGSGTVAGGSAKQKLKFRRRFF